MLSGKHDQVQIMARHRMRQLNLAEAKARFSELVDAAARGDGTIIAKSGTPVAKLVPLHHDKRTPIKFGTLKGKIWIAENFDDPLPNDVLDEFEKGAAVLLPIEHWRKLQRAARPALKELLLADVPRAEIPLARRGRHRRRNPSLLD
jgi:prevent-host-death family protein